MNIQDFIEAFPFGHWMMGLSPEGFALLLIVALPILLLAPVFVASHLCRLGFMRDLDK